MNFSYRDDQLLVRDTVRDFVRSRIVPEASGWNENGEFPLELLPELAALGLTGLAVPHEYGGAELDMLTIALVMEELGAGDGSVALTIAAHNSLCIGHLLIGASEEQKGRWLPPLARWTRWWISSPRADRQPGTRQRPPSRRHTKRTTLGRIS